jgi:hypothetical protein
MVAARAEALQALTNVEEACDGTPLKGWLADSTKVERLRPRIDSSHSLMIAQSLIELDADLRLEVLKYQALLIPPERVTDYVNPLFRW